jgi:hypothetical protein
MIPLLAERKRGPERCIEIVEHSNKPVTAPFDAGCAVLRKEHAFSGLKALSKVLRLRRA